MTERYTEKIYFYNGVRKIVRRFTHIIPEDPMRMLAKAFGAARYLQKPVNYAPIPDDYKNVLIKPLLIP